MKLWSEINNEEIIVRLATLDDVDNILAFLHDYWKVDHIFVQDRQFIIYVYNTEGTRINFMIGIGEKTKLIYGIRGFIPSNKSMHPDIRGAIWKKAPYAPRGFGRYLVECLTKTIKPRVMVGISISNDGVAARNKMHEIHGYLKHYYILADTDKFRIADIKNFCLTDYNNRINYT